MLCLIKTELQKLKRVHVLLIGLIGMTLPSILSVFTQAVVTQEAQTTLFDFPAFLNSTLWNSATIFMPVLFPLVGGYLINREYTDHTLKSILPVPVSFQRLLYGKLVTMGLISVWFGLYGYAIMLIVGLLSGISGMNTAMVFTGLVQMAGVSLFAYVAILPILVWTSRKPGGYMGGVIVSFLFGYSAMFIKDVTMRSLYPILSGLTVVRFDMGSFMNTSEPTHLRLSLLSLAFMLLLTAGMVMLTHPPQSAPKPKKQKTGGRFSRQGQQKSR